MFDAFKITKIRERKLINSLHKLLVEVSIYSAKTMYTISILHNVIPHSLTLQSYTQRETSALAFQDLHWNKWRFAVQAAPTAYFLFFFAWARAEENRQWMIKASQKAGRSDNMTASQSAGCNLIARFQVTYTTLRWGRNEREERMNNSLMLHNMVNFNAPLEDQWKRLLTRQKRAYFCRETLKHYEIVFWGFPTF